MTKEELRKLLEERDRLKAVIRHAYHYMESQKSYSEEERYFVFRALEQRVQICQEFKDPLGK